MRSLTIKTSSGIDVEVRRARGMGRGVFASVNIPAGALIDTNPTWDLSPEDIKKFGATSIGGYWFHNPKDKSHGLIALGMISLINHSFSPNAEISWSKGSIGWIASLGSIRSISSGTQIFVDYGLRESELLFLHPKGIKAKK